MNDNTFILFNDITLKIYTTKDFESMRRAVIYSLRFLVPCSGAVFYLASAAERYKLTSPVGIGFRDECINIYLSEFQDYDRTTWPYAAPISKAYDDSSFIQDEMRLGTDFYKRVYAPHQVHYQVTLTLIHNGIFLGIIALVRSKEQGEFKPRELFLLEQLAVHLGARLYQHHQVCSAAQRQLPDLQLLLDRYHLTVREIEVLSSILKEIRSDDICRTLSISPNTFKKHVVHIYRKLDVNNRFALFQKIMEL